jgi:hypothetical protein
MCEVLPAVLRQFLAHVLASLQGNGLSAELAIVRCYEGTYTSGT